MATITYTTDPVGTGALGTSQFLRSMSQKGRLQPNQFVYVSSLEDLGKLRLCVDSILVTINVDCLKCQGLWNAMLGQGVAIKPNRMLAIRFKGPYEQNTEFEEADLYTDIFPHAVSISNRAVKMSLEELKGELDLS